MHWQSEQSYIRRCEERYLLQMSSCLIDFRNDELEKIHNVSILNLWRYLLSNKYFSLYMSIQINSQKGQNTLGKKIMVNFCSLWCELVELIPH